MGCIVERKWIIAAVGDIRGFGIWTTRSAVTVEIQEPFIKSFYDGMQNYVLTRLDSTFKYTGDGFQIIKELDLSSRKNGKIIEFIEDLKKLISDSKSSIAACGPPPPDGFRIRIFSGFVFKLMVLDPNDPERKRLIPEYVGYALNTAHRLLVVNPEIPCLCDGKLAVGKRSFFRMRQLGHPSVYPNGVDKEDVNGLKVLHI